MRTSTIAAFAAAFSLAASAPASAQTPGRGVYAALEDMAAAAISPDGARIATLRPYEGRRAAFLYAAGDTSQPTRVVATPEGMFISNIAWASDTYVLLEVRQHETTQTTRGLREWTAERLVSLDADSGAIKVLLANDVLSNAGLGDIVAYLPDDDEHILMKALAYDVSSADFDSRLEDGEGHFELAIYRTNLRTGRGRRVSGGVEDTIDIITDAAGEPVVRIDYDADAADFTVRRMKGDHGVIYHDPETELLPFTLVSAQSSDALVARGYFADGNRSFNVLDAATGALTPLGRAPEGLDVARGPIIDPHRNTFVGYAYIDDYAEQRFTDPELERWRSALDNALPDERVSLVSWNRARDTFIVYGEGPGFPGSFSLFHTADMHLDPIGFARPQLTPERVARVERIAYAARDGLTIPAYVTHPLAGGGAPAPLIILAHGGPQARDAASFDWLAQYFASRGYVVLQANFRGSDGYGGPFRDAGFSEWGGRMIDDIADGAAKLIADGVADPERVCAVGGSYGGYAALALAMKGEIGLDCVVSINGVTDLPSLLATTLTGAGGGDSAGTNYWRAYIGDRFADAERLTAWSPAQHPRAFHTPVLVLHARDDTTVPYDQAELMMRNAREAGAPFTLETISGDDHYLSEGASREMVLAEIEAFLDANLR